MIRTERTAMWRWLSPRTEEAWEQEKDTFVYSFQHDVFKDAERLSEGQPIHLYAIYSEADTFKFGVAADPSKRLRQLQSGSAHKLHLIAAVPATRAMEKFLHAVLADYRLAGEWFAAVPRVLAIVELLVSAEEQVSECSGDVSAATTIATLTVEIEEQFMASRRRP